MRLSFVLRNTLSENTVAALVRIRSPGTPFPNYVRKIVFGENVFWATLVRNLVSENVIQDSVC
ncbi:hypothetical protein D3C83_197790 [compost metagenome]